MKRITAFALFAATGILGVGSALAQDHQVRATVPFNFTVANKQLPSGTYTIFRVHNDLIAVQSQDGTNLVLSTAYSDSNQLANRAKLVFDRLGDQYFLHEVVGGPGVVSLNLPLTKSEKRARNQQTLALNQSQISIPISEGN
jgi:hypothetical protein